MDYSSMRPTYLLRPVKSGFINSQPSCRVQFCQDEMAYVLATLRPSTEFPVALVSSSASAKPAGNLTEECVRDGLRWCHLVPTTTKQQPLAILTGYAEYRRFVLCSSVLWYCLEAGKTIFGSTQHPHSLAKQRRGSSGGMPVALNSPIGDRWMSL